MVSQSEGTMKPRFIEKCSGKDNKNNMKIIKLKMYNKNKRKKFTKIIKL